MKSENATRESFLGNPVGDTKENSVVSKLDDKKPRAPFAFKSGQILFQKRTVADCETPNPSMDAKEI